MKLLFLVNHFAEYGGIQKMLDHKILAFKKYSNFEIVLVTRFQNQRQYLYPSHEFTKKYDLNLDGNSSFLKNQLIKFKFYKQLNFILKTENPDVVITTLTSFYALMLPFICPKIPKIIEFHSTAKTMKAGQWKYKQFFYKKYNAIVVLNKDEQNSFDLKNTFVIPNFIHQETPILYSNFQNRQKTIIAAGRLETVKQFDHLILAWSKIRHNFQDWKIEIYGEGSLKEELQTLINENELNKSVVLKGNTNNLHQIMTTASLYCMTSKTDCFPMVLLESKQAGLPIISYDCPFGPKNIIKDKIDGLLIENKNIAAFSEAIKFCILNENHRELMSQNAFINFAEFSSESVIQRWLTLFKQLK